MTRWGPWSGGTLTSDSLGLGDSDAESRWIGVRRHQAVLAVAGLGLTSAWLLRTSAPLGELLVGTAFLVGAVPTRDGLTLGETSRRCVRAFFVARSGTTSTFTSSVTT